MISARDVYCHITPQLSCERFYKMRAKRASAKPCQLQRTLNSIRLRRIAHPLYCSFSVPCD